MFKKRLILLLCIILTGVLASFYGGSFSYALFYICFAVPLSCLAYTVFIYHRLKIHQNLETKITVKGDKIPYKFMLVNEDFIFYKEIITEFLSDYSRIDLDGLRQTLSLKAGEKIIQETELVCLYRGEYKVGLKSVSFTDFLGLFKITRKNPSEMNVRVYPRVIKLNTLSALSFNNDAKISPFSFMGKRETADSELREYMAGDAAGLINWRASASKNKLFVRKYAELPKETAEIYLDLTPVDKKRGMAVAIEDKMLEAALSITDFYLNNGISSRLNYFDGESRVYNTDTPEGFQNFYDACLELKFDGGINFGEYITKSLAAKKTAALAVIITANINVELNMALYKITSGGAAGAIVLVGNYEADELAKIRGGLLEIKTGLVHIPENGRTADILDS